MNDRHFLPSVKPGHAFSCYVGKTNRGNLVAHAQEGELRVSPGFGFSFSHTLLDPTSTFVRVSVPTEATRATTKAKDAAFVALFVELRRQGVIPEGAKFADQAAVCSFLAERDGQESVTEKACA